MSADKASPRLVRFWWILAAMAGALAGALATAFLPLGDVLWGIGAIVPIAFVVGLLEWGGGKPRSKQHPMARSSTWPEKRGRSMPAATGNLGYKQSPRRGQLHAIARRKNIDPPSSGGAGGNS